MSNLYSEPIEENLDDEYLHCKDINEDPSDEEIEIALHNYECSVYNELDRRIYTPLNRRIWSHL